MNAFLELAEQQISNPRKARMRAAEKRVLERELQERDRMFRMWRKWHREQRDLLLAGPYGEAARELADFLEVMTLEQEPALITLVERGPWRNADPDSQYQVLRLVDHAIAHRRERAGLAPFSDSVPWIGQPPTAFEIIHEVLSS